MLNKIGLSKELESKVISLMSEVMARDDVLEDMTSLLVKGASNLTDDEHTNEKLIEVLTKVVKNRQVKDEFLKSYLYTPLRSWIPFGFRSESS